MNTITTTASNNSSILAIDLGKYKSVACLLDCNGEFRFTTFDTTRDEVRKLVGQHQPGVVIIEACLLAGWVQLTHRPAPHQVGGVGGSSATGEGLREMAQRERLRCRSADHLTDR
jgi:hypothetical protein